LCAYARPYVTHLLWLPGLRCLRGGCYMQLGSLSRRSWGLHLLAGCSSIPCCLRSGGHLVACTPVPVVNVLRHFLRGVMVLGRKLGTTTQNRVSRLPLSQYLNRKTEIHTCSTNRCWSRSESSEMTISGRPSCCTSRGHLVCFCRTCKERGGRT